MSTIVSYEGVWNSMPAEVLLGGLDDGRGLDGWESIDFVEIAVMVNGDQVSSTLEFKQVLGNKLPW